MGNTVSDSEFHVVGPQMANCFDHICSGAMYYKVNVVLHNAHHH